MSWTNFDLTETRRVVDELGIFARCDILEKIVVGVFDGVVEVFTLAADGQVDWRGLDGGMSIHLKLSGGRLYAIMPIPGAPVSGIDYINHSCRPNCRVDAGGLVVETTRFIGQDEQLTINYHEMDLIKLGRVCWCENVPENERCIL